MKLVCTTDRTIVFYDDEIEKAKKYLIWTEESIAEYANDAVGQRPEDEIAEEVNDIREFSKEISEAENLKEIAEICNFYAYIFEEFWEVEDNRPKNLEKLKRDFGTVTYEDKEYILLEQAEIGEDNFGNCIFIAKAIREEDEVDMYGYQAVYEMIWYPCDDFNPCEDEDFGDACDWDSPDKLEKLHAEYDVEYKRFL